MYRCTSCCWPRVGAATPASSPTSTSNRGIGSGCSASSSDCSRSTCCLHRDNHEPTTKRALVESSVWIACGLAFSVVVLAVFGGQAFGEYLSGYVIEKSLSVDNVFVWAVIFSTFAIPLRYQHRVLFWGIFGALVLRAVFIFAGTALIEQFWWLLLVFGAVLIVVGHQGGAPPRRRGPARSRPRGEAAGALPPRAQASSPARSSSSARRASGSPRRCSPHSSWSRSPTSIFAVDSVPAILAVSREPFIVFSSNAFAILGLRALYFLLGGARRSSTTCRTRWARSSCSSGSRWWCRTGGTCRRSRRWR